MYRLRTKLFTKEGTHPYITHKETESDRRRNLTKGSGRGRNKIKSRSLDTLSSALSTNGSVTFNIKKVSEELWGYEMKTWVTRTALHTVTRIPTFISGNILRPVKFVMPFIRKSGAEVLGKEHFKQCAVI